MGKVIKIPTCRNPFDIVINNAEYSYPAGAEVEVPDEVAHIIECHENALHKPIEEANSGGASSGGGSPEGGGASSGGGAELNIAYGDTPPEDTTKLWVKTSEPSGVEVASEIEAVPTVNYDITLLKETLPSTMVAQTHIVGDKAYLLYGKNVCCYDFTNKVTETFLSIIPVVGYASSVVGEKIYIITSGSNYNVAINVYDTRTNAVTTLATTTDYSSPLPVAFTNGTLIYIFGGKKLGVDALTSDIRCLDTETEILTTLDVSLPNTLRWANGITIDDKIYIFGGNKDGTGSGIGSGTLLNTIVCFDTTTNSCSNLSTTLPKAARWIACASIDNIVYLFGGGVKGTTLNGIKIDTICRFNPRNNEISVLNIKLPIALAEVGALSYGGEIFLFGGDSGVDTSTKVDTIYKCKDEHNKGQKWYGSNRSRRY